MNLKKIFAVNYLKSLYLDPKLSVLVFPKVHLGIAKNSSIKVEKRLNLGSTWPYLGYSRSQLKVEPNAHFAVTGYFNIKSGFLISVNEGSTLTLGSGYINSNCNIACFNKIDIGNDVAIAENVTIRDTDNHYIYRDGYEISKPITIEDHVWIGMNATILKGVTIGAGSIVAAGSIVTKDVPSNCLVAGTPAKVIKHDIYWGDKSNNNL
ncbi:acyltransferase [Latilactobacillus sakei]|uniref:acyltransferase n=1 Tax=Latilactobacillus sakei TaxID=1599 RepID=UPI003F5293C8